MQSAKCKIQVIIMRILYSFPAFLYGVFMTLIGMSLGIGGFALEAWIYVLLLLIAAVLLCMNKWWGCFPGMVVGGIIIYTEHVFRKVRAYSR